jgi:V8-like Glu-specific endopeptidase
VLFSCDHTLSDVPLWYDNIVESLIREQLSHDVYSHEFSVITREGHEYTGTLAEIRNSPSTSFKLRKIKNMNCFVQQDKLFDDRMESVIGVDDRKRQDPTIFPFTAMGLIERGCTGTFIGSNVVLTAGHCIHYKGNWCNLLNFYHRKDCGNHLNVTSYEWTHAITLKKWVNGNSDDSDIAWIIYSTSSPITVSYTNETPNIGTAIFIYGYPGDKPNITNPDLCLWGSSCSSFTRLKRRLAYECDTYNGMSGSAIFYHRDGRPVIIGVHTDGIHSCCPSGLNKGVRLTKKYKHICDEIISMTN